MRKLLTALLLCLLFSGCAQQAPSTPDAEETAPQSVSEVFPEAKAALEAQYGGKVQATPLSVHKVRGMRQTEDGILLFSGYGNTVLTLMTDESTASLELAFELDFQDPSICTGDDLISYFDPVARETVILDGALQEIRRIALPEELSGSPILSDDGRILYYCTPNSIHAWDLESGIRRRLKELSYEEQTLSGVHCQGTVLQCRILDGDQTRTLFLNSETGTCLQSHDGEIELSTAGESYFASFLSGMVTSLIFGDAAEAPQALYPEDSSAEGFFLPAANACVTVSSQPENAVLLTCYDLESGMHRSALALDALHIPKAIDAIDADSVLLLIYDPEFDCDAILRWNLPEVQPSEDLYTERYYTAKCPDETGLSQCRSYAQEISRKYGVEVLIGSDAAAVEPWDYEFTPEYRCRVIWKQLQTLEQCLAQYPEEILPATASHFDNLKICLVQQISGSAAAGSLDLATGIQFLNGKDAHVVIAAGKYAQQALYHELFHVMETHIFGGSTALDSWKDLNPAGFEYDLDYSANARRNSGVYLQDGQRAFVDTYSMSFPKEDRARILEYAMLSGQKALFQSDTMQAKLKAICIGIREAYGLKKSEEAFLWEQYLEKSLAYRK